MVAWIGVEEWRWGGVVRFYYNLKEEAAGFAGRAGVVWEGKKESRMMPNFLTWATGKVELPKTEMEKLQVK